MSIFTPQPVTAAQVIAEARRYVGARFGLNGRSTTEIDCAGLVECVGKALGQIAPSFTAPAYAPTALYRLLPVLWEHVDEIAIEDVPPGGGYVLAHTRTGLRRARHLAITTGTRLIQMHHSPIEQVARVTESRIDEAVRSLFVTGWKFRGLQE